MRTNGCDTKLLDSPFKKKMIIRPTKRSAIMDFFFLSREKLWGFNDRRCDRMKGVITITVSVIATAAIIGGLVVYFNKKNAD